MIDYKQKIKSLAIVKVDKNLLSLVDYVLNDDRFLYWSGSEKKEHHHYGDGGLIKHTWEVIHLCFTNKDALDNKDDLNDDVLFLSALYHDIGKLWDYYENSKGIWKPTSHKRFVHHISRSGIEWSYAIKTRCPYLQKCPALHDIYHDEILHAILAHHGCREYGSPVAPKSKEAWLLHLCDGISARMDDWNKIDIIEK